MRIAWRIFELLRKQGPLSRPEIARHLGVSKPTVSTGVRLLLEANLVHEAGYADSDGGRRPHLVGFNPKAGFVIGMDVGGTTARAALANLQGTICASMQERTKPNQKDELIAQLVAMTRNLSSQVSIDSSDLVTVAIGTPGVISDQLKTIHYAPNLPALEDPLFIKHLRTALDVHVTLENDVNVAALGERWQGAAQGLNDFVFMSIGTGFGLGLVLEGKLYRGATGRAGEFGYAPLLGDVATNLEEILSGPPLAKRHREAGGSGRTEDAFDEASRGLEPGRGVVKAFLEQLASALAAVTSLLDPQAVILGGGIGIRCHPFLEELQHKLAEQSPIRPRLMVSTLGGDAGVYGALDLALRKSRSLIFERGGDGTASVNEHTEARLVGYEPKFP